MTRKWYVVKSPTGRYIDEFHCYHRKLYSEYQIFPSGRLPYTPDKHNYILVGRGNKPSVEAALEFMNPTNKGFKND